MSTGDLLFIFAFIVLPTIILVSCIWTLLLIRAGVLLPARRFVLSDADAQSDEEQPQAADAVAATAVHELPAATRAAEPATVEIVEMPETAAALPAPEPVAAIEPGEDSVEPVAAVSAEPPADEAADVLEHTTDFPIIDDTMLEQAAPAEEVSPEGSPTPVEPPPVSRPEAPPPVSTEPEPELDVLFVPLPDDEPTLASSSNGIDEPEVVDEIDAAVVDSEPDGGEPGEHAEHRSGRSRRKPVRRVAQLRPSEEQATSVSPMGNLLRRSRSGNPR